MAEFRRLNSYALLYLAFPVAPGEFQVSAREECTLEELAAIAGGLWDDRILHLGCSRTLQKLTPKQADKLRRDTGAAMLSGYTGTLEYFPMTILELSYFGLLDTYKTPAAIAKHLGEQQRFWIKELGFKLFG